MFCIEPELSVFQTCLAFIIFLPYLSSIFFAFGKSFSVVYVFDGGDGAGAFWAGFIFLHESFVGAKLFIETMGLFDGSVALRAAAFVLSSFPLQI